MRMHRGLGVVFENITFTLEIKKLNKNEMSNVFSTVTLIGDALSK